MMHVTEPVVPVTETTPAKAARAMTYKIGDNAANPDQAYHTDDQADPFRMRGGERQCGDRHAATDY